MTDLVIRRAVPADLPDLHAAFAAAYAPYRAAIPDLPDVTGDLAEDIVAHDFWVAELAGRVVGGLVLLSGDPAYLRNLAVHPDAAGQGVAKRLITEAEDHLRADGVTHWGLTTHRKMTGTQAVYLKLGWRVVQEDGTRIFMERDISPV